MKGGAALALLALAGCGVSTEPATPAALDLTPGRFVLFIAANTESNPDSYPIDIAATRPCFQVLGRNADSVAVRHVSGLEGPGGAEVYTRPGERDRWFASERFRAQNPEAGPLAELALMWRNVGACPPDPADLAALKAGQRSE